MTKTFVNKIPVRSHVFEHCNILEKSDSCSIGTTWCKITAINQTNQNCYKNQCFAPGKKGNKFLWGLLLPMSSFPSCLGGI